MTETRSRREPRIDIDLSVTVQLPDDAIEYPVGDASYRGVFLISEDPLPLRKLVRIETQLAGDAESLQMMGLVAHHISPPEAAEMEREPGMGIHLFSVGEETHRRWRKFVREKYESDPKARIEYKRLEFPHVVAHLPTHEELADYFDDELTSGEMFVRSSEVHPEGESIICDVVHSDGDRALDLEGKVADTVKSPPRKRGMKIRFDDLDEENQRRIRAFIDGDFEAVERRTTSAQEEAQRQQ